MTWVYQTIMCPVFHLMNFMNASLGLVEPFNCKLLFHPLSALQKTAFDWQFIWNAEMKRVETGMII